MITIQELLGTDNVAPSRLTINSNFLLIENEINDLENTFNINVVTGAMDVSQATSGQIKAKALYADQAVFPASATPTINLYGTGASAGNATFSGSVSSSQISVSGTGTFGKITAGASTFTSSVAFSGSGTSGNVTYNSSLISGTSGNFIEKNTLAASGPSNQFASALGTGGGGGLVGTYSNPYYLTFKESVIYANCCYVSTATADGGTGATGHATGFFFAVATGSGGNTTAVPQGFKLTIVNTGNNGEGGIIPTGIQGPSGSTYYTGFSTTNGTYDGAGINITDGYAYKSSITVMWENRIGKNLTSQSGSWVVLSQTGSIGY